MIDKIVAIINPDSSAGRRLRDEAKTGGLLVDATQGRRCRAMIIAETRHVILSSLSTDSLSARINHGDEEKKHAE